MDFKATRDRHLHDIERLTRELLTALQKAHLNHEVICQQLGQMEKDASDERKARFDSVDDAFQGY